MPHKKEDHTEEIHKLGTAYSRVIEDTKKQVGVFYYPGDDLSTAVATATANAVDGDCIPMSVNMGGDDSLFLFSDISAYDVIIFGTSLKDGKIPDSVDRFFEVTKKRITCKAVHMFVATSCSAERAQRAMKHFVHLLASHEPLKMPTTATSTLIVTPKTLDKITSNAMLCVSECPSIADALRVIGFHPFHNVHVAGCSHIKSCPHRHIKSHPRPQAEEEKQVEKSVPKKTDEKESSEKSSEESSKESSNESSNESSEESEESEKKPETKQEEEQEASNSDESDSEESASGSSTSNKSSSDESSSQEE